MSEVLEIIKRAGRIPLNELTLRSSQKPEAVATELQALQRDGLVTVRGNIPPPDQMVSHGGDTVVLASEKTRAL